MDKSMIKGVAVGGLAMVVLGAGGVTGYKTLTKPKFAEVVAVKEVTETVVTPREHCEDVQVQHQAPVKDERRIAGTVVGGLAGGLLGSAVGGGKGKTLATVAGAAAGGYAGNQVQKNMQQKDVVTTTEHRCKTLNDKSQKLVGYNVTYRLDGKDGTVRTSFKPGPTLPVKDGQVVTTPPSGPTS
ncbi:MAG: glycine zipper 2TM domain-containing protein [Burkholderiales bacterium]